MSVQNASDRSAIDGVSPCWLLIIDSRVSQTNKLDLQNQCCQSLSQTAVANDQLHVTLVCRSSSKGVHAIYTNEADVFDSSVLWLALLTSFSTDKLLCYYCS